MKRFSVAVSERRERSERRTSPLAPRWSFSRALAPAPTRSLAATVASYSCM